MTIFLLGPNGERLMPAANAKKVRKLPKRGRAHICSHDPFAIQLGYMSESMNPQSAITRVVREHIRIFGTKPLDLPQTRLCVGGR